MTKKHAPTDADRAKVKIMTAMGITEFDISTVMGVSPPTLRKYYSQELAVGHIESTTKVAQSLFRQATDPIKPNVAAGIFWMKCRAGWKEDASDGGKKEVLQDRAHAAGEGTGWGDDLRANPTALN